MPPGRRTRILIVDDSAVMRSLLRSVSRPTPHSKWPERRAMVSPRCAYRGSLRPDLVLLDVEMPVMDGLVTLRKLRARGHRVPVIMCSALTQRGAAVTIEALAAAPRITWPSPAASRPRAGDADPGQELLPKIHALTAPAESAAPVSACAAPPVCRCAAPPLSRNLLSRPRPPVLVIGVSTGGPAALDICCRVAAHFPLPVLIVQHMPELFTAFLAERLAALPSARGEAAEGDAVLPGTDRTSRAATGTWRSWRRRAPGQPPTPSDPGPPENHCRPAVDVLFRTAAASTAPACWPSCSPAWARTAWSARASFANRAGPSWRRIEATSAVWGMPGAVPQLVWPSAFCP